ncbi:MAG: aminotransferase class I/II-fold pyridoxal phosphate-dependent enzyme [Elusimicrobiota bacterium]
MTSFKEELDDLESRGLKRTLPKEEAGSLINFSSNDYLGLSREPEILKIVHEAIEKYGVGGRASRLLTCKEDPYSYIENDLKNFLRKEAALVYGSGYHTNTGVLKALTTSSDFILFDRLTHASLIDGIRLSQALYRSFEHNNLEELKEKLTRYRKKAQRTFIVTEGIFSMDGDKPNIKEIVRLAKEWDCLVYLDEAHSLGILGHEGRGLADEQGVLEEIDIHVGTLSKTLGTQGGFVAGNQNIIDLLISKSRSFIYSTALSPLSAEAARAALGLFPKLEEKRQKVLDVAQYVRQELSHMEFDTLTSQTQIIPVWTGSAEMTQVLSYHLKSAGLFVPSIRPPTVPMGEGRVRLSISYEVVQHVEKLLKAFKLFKYRPRREKNIVTAH